MIYSSESYPKESTTIILELKKLYMLYTGLLYYEYGQYIVLYEIFPINDLYKMQITVQIEHFEFE